MHYIYYNIENLSPNLSVDESFFAKKLSSFTARVVKESVSFANLDFIDELIASLDMLTPYLQSFKHMVLLGVGGSALGPRALQESFSPKGPCALENQEQRHLWIIDNTDSVLFQDCLTNLDPQQTVVLVISKSGATMSTIAQYQICKKWLQDTLQVHTTDSALKKNWHEHIFVVTDPDKGFLRDEVKKYNFASLPIPKDMSGRFSIFSAVGMVSSAFLGINYLDFLEGAKSARGEFFTQAQTFLERDATKQVEKQIPSLLKMAYFAYTAMEGQFSQLIFFSYIPKWERLSNWFCQLWSESLGKSGHGSTPIPTLGATDQHSILQLFLDGKKDKACLFLSHTMNANKEHAETSNSVPLEIEKEWAWLAGKSLTHILEAEALATRTTLVNSGMPLINLEFESTSEYEFGKIAWNLCMLTVLTAYFLDINPFDQPAVEEGKKLTKASLS